MIFLLHNYTKKVTNIVIIKKSNIYIDKIAFKGYLQTLKETVNAKKDK